MKYINPSSASFEDIISNNGLYVDKTQYLYELVNKPPTYYFLSRPRRFGKTITINTLEAIFKGKKELFKDLYIGKTDYDFKKYPIIHIDFGECQKTTKEEVKVWLNNRFLDIAKEYSIQLTKKDGYSENLIRLIDAISKDEKVVVLIDEYDKPISSNVDNPEILGIRDVLRGFFEILKVSFACIRFVFITGVTKYAKMSVFSSMNNIVDLSMDEDYATMLGYTQEELENNFSEYINEGMKHTNLSRSVYLQKLKEKYDGYCFSLGIETVYNPVSIGLFFGRGKGKDFQNYWAETGGNAKLIIDIAKRVNFNIDLDLKETISKTMIASYDIVDMVGRDTDSVLLKSLMLQSGYLTIVKATGYDNQELVLDFPNDEVRETFTKGLISIYIGTKAERNFSPYKIIPYFLEGDTASFIETLKGIYASIPNEVSKNLKESSYHLAFYCMLKSCGADIDAEVSSSKERADAILENDKHIYVIEFKVDKTAAEALSQIKEKSYYDSYIIWKKKKVVHLVGINFSSVEKNISDYIEEIL